MSELPRVIEGQEKKADEMIAQLAKGQMVEVVEDTPHPVAEGDKPPAEAQPVVDTPHAEEPAGDDFQQKYSVLQGKYNNEIADWKRRVDVAQQTIDRQNRLILELHDRVSGLESGGAQASPPAESGDGMVDSSGLKTLDPEEFEGYGPEMRDLVSGFNMLMERNKHLEGRLEQGQRTTEDQRWATFTTQLAGIVSDWEAMNVDEGFLSWLNGYDTPRDTMTRKEKLDQFVGAYNAPRAAQFFLDYKAEAGAAPADTPAPKREQVIQPDPSAAAPGAPISGNESQNVTAADVKAAGERYVKGEISYEELDKIQDAFQRSLAKSKGR